MRLDEGFGCYLDCEKDLGCLVSNTHHGCFSYRVECRRDEERPGPNNCRRKLPISLKSGKSLSGRTLDDADDYPSDIEKDYHEHSMSECCNGVDEV